MHEKLSELIAKLHQYIEAFSCDRFVKSILYSSQRRGALRPDSEIDVLIVLKEPNVG